MFAFRMAGLRMSAKLRLDYLKALFALSITVLDTLPSGQASNTLTNTANVLQIGISEKLGTFFQFTSLMITAIIVAFTYSWSLTLVTSAVIVAVVVIYGVAIPIIVKMQKEVEHADEKASSIAGEVLASIRMIVACGAEDRIGRKYAGWVKEAERRSLKMSPFVGIQFAPCELAPSLYLNRVLVSSCCQARTEAFATVFLPVTCQISIKWSRYIPYDLIPVQCQYSYNTAKFETLVVVCIPFSIVIKSKNGHRKFFLIFCLAPISITSKRSMDH